MIYQHLSSVSGRSISGARSFWSILLFTVYAVYLFSALTVPFIGKAAAGCLLLLGLFGLCRLKAHYYDLTVAEKWLLASFALFSLVSIASFYYWPQTREARIHLEDYITFLMLVPLYLLLRQFRFNFSWVLVLLGLVAITLGAVSIAQYAAMKYFQTQVLISDNVWSHLWMRPSGGVNPMRYAAISLVLAMMPLNAILLLRQKTFRLKVLLVLAFCMGLSACLLTQVRGAWLAIPVLALVYGMYLYRTGHPRFLLGLVMGGGF